MLTEIGPVEIDVPRDTGSTFDPQIAALEALESSARRVLGASDDPLD